MKRVAWIFAICLFAIHSLATAFNGVCVAPFRYGQSPTGSIGPSRDQVVSDIVFAKKWAKSVRSFGIDKEYLKWIPEVCESLSVSYLVSGWASFNYNNTWNQAAVDLRDFLKKADSLDYKGLKGIVYAYNNFPERFAYYSEQSIVTDLKAKINSFKALIKAYDVEISHEENWDVWLRHPDLADSLDFVSIRIIPQDDLINDPKAGADYVFACYDSVKKVFPDKRVVITSVGWSTYNSSESRQKEFINLVAADTTLDYYIHELADQEWKGTLNPDGNYGLFTSSRQEKIVVYHPTPRLSFDKLFNLSEDRLDGIYYYFPAFRYPSSITATALKKDAALWADSMASLAQFSFFYSEDISRSDGAIEEVFFENGNDIVASSDYYNVYPPRRKTKIIMTKVNFSFQYSSYIDSASAREAVFEGLRRQAQSLRDGSVYDSACLAIDFDWSMSDNVVFDYPAALEHFDAYSWGMNFSGVKDEGDPNKYLDSLLGLFKSKHPDKLAIISLSGVSGFVGSKKDTTTLNAFMAARKKYGYPIIFSNISGFYESDMKKPSSLYRYLLPDRFPAAVSLMTSGSIKSLSGLSCAGRGVKAFVGGSGGVLCLYDLQGRMVLRRVLAGNSSVFLDERSLPRTVGIAKLLTGDRSMVMKVATFNQ